MDFYKYVKNLFTKESKGYIEEPILKEKIDTGLCREVLKDGRFDFDFGSRESDSMIEYDSQRPNILIIDDSPGITSIVIDYFEELHHAGIIDIHKFNILAFSGKHAPFLMNNTLIDYDIKKIDYAIIDIILPGRMKVCSKQTKMDGIDVSIILNEKYHCDNFVFFTGNVVSEYIDYIKEKVDRYFKYFGTHIKEQIIFKKGGEQDTKLEFEDLMKGKYNINRLK